MAWLNEVEWEKVLLPDTPLLEIFVRGTITYLALFFLLRLVMKRESAALGVTDLLVVVLIADAAQNAMAGEYTSLPDGILLVAVIVGWAAAFDWLGYRYRRFEPVVRPPRLPLIKDGQLMLENMRKELVTREELRSLLRQQGVEEFSEVRAAYMEPNGHVSVLQYDQES